MKFKPSVKLNKTLRVLYLLAQVFLLTLSVIEANNMDIKLDPEMFV